MSESDYVQVINNCQEEVVVHLHRRRPKKGRPPIGVASVKLEPGEKTAAMPRQWLVGARGWEELRNRDCVALQSVEFEPRYVQLLNDSTEPLSIVIRVPRPKAAARLKTISLKPKQTSPVFDLKTVRDQKRLRRLVSAKKLSVYPDFSIGSATGRGEAIGSYYGEDVYTCYDCGRPIVFRGAPPPPVHI